MEEYKDFVIKPICDELMERAETCGDLAEKLHLESVTKELSDAWDQSIKKFQESENTPTINALSNLDFQFLVSHLSSKR